jgi:hypothetical protein
MTIETVEHILLNRRGFPQQPVALVAIYQPLETHETPEAVAHLDLANGFACRKTIPFF